MKTKEKAKELVDKYRNVRWDIDTITAKRCSLIAVDEIINSNPHSNTLNTEVYSTMKYWQQVKTEIEKL